MTASHDTKPHLPAAVDRTLSAALAVAQAIAGIAVLACALMATVDTVGLWLFNSPLTSVVETSQVLLIVITFFGLGAAERSGAHIAVTIVRDVLPRLLRQASHILARAVSIMAYLAIGVAGIASANRSFKSNEYSGGLIAFPIYPFKYILVLGTLLAVLAALAVLIRRPGPPKPDIYGKDRL